MLQTVAAQDSIGSSSRFSPLFKQFRQTVTVIVLGLLAYFLISHYVLQSVTVIGQSMTPTLGDSQHYLLNRWIYHVRQPQRSDVVVLRDPLDNGFSVKRIVAAGGDSVYLKDGAIYVNGQLMQESYLAAGTKTFASVTVREQFFKCAPNQYFVLGDNRGNSIDSRAYGPVPKQNILGMIVY